MALPLGASARHWLPEQVVQSERRQQVSPRSPLHALTPFLPPPPGPESSHSTGGGDTEGSPRRQTIGPSRRLPGSQSTSPSDSTWLCLVPRFPPSEPGSSDPSVAELRSGLDVPSRRGSWDMLLQDRGMWERDGQGGWRETLSPEDLSAPGRASDDVAAKKKQWEKDRGVAGIFIPILREEFTNLSSKI